MTFKVWYEDAGGGNAAVHVEVYKWSPSCYRAIDERVIQLVGELVQAGYHTAWAVGAKHPRFCEHMGGEYITTVRIDDTDYEVFRWELLHQS